MRVLACEAVEAALLERQPDPDGAVAAHLDRCAACADLAEALCAVEPLAVLPGPTPPPALVERTLAAAVGEVRIVARARRRTVLVAGLKAAAVFLASLPLLAGFQAAVALVGGDLVREALPPGAVLYVELVWALFVLAALSAVGFTLTLVAGAAGRPPRREALLEVPHG